MAHLKKYFSSSLAARWRPEVCSGNLYRVTNYVFVIVTVNMHMKFEYSFNYGQMAVITKIKVLQCCSHVSASGNVKRS